MNTLLLVEWVDIVADVGWEPSSHVTKTHPCHSVGWLMFEDKNTIVLCSTKSTVDRRTETNNRIAIPKATIISKKVLNGRNKR